MKRSHLIHLTIFTAAFLVRFVGMPPPIVLVGDEEAYHNLAVSLTEGHGSRLEGQTYSRPPLYAFFLAGIYRLFGVGNFKAVHLTQSFLGASVCNLIYAMASRIFTPTVALVAATAAIFNLSLAAASARLLSECLFTFFLVSAFLFLQIGKEKEAALPVAGFFLALSVLSRAVVLLLPFAVGAVWILGEGRKGIRKAALVIGVFLLVLLPLAVRNYSVYRRFVPVSTQGGYAFYNSYHPEDGKFFGFNAVDETTARADRLGSETAKSDYLFRETLKGIRENPFRTARLEILKFLYFWAPFDWEVRGEGRYQFVYGFLFPFFILGSFWARGRRMFLLIPVLYALALALVFYGSPRLRLPTEPFILILGALGLVETFRRSPHRAMAVGVVVSLLAVHVIVGCHPIGARRFLGRSLERVGVW